MSITTSTNFGIYQREQQRKSSIHSYAVVSWPSKHNTMFQTLQANDFQTLTKPTGVSSINILMATICNYKNNEIIRMHITLWWNTRWTSANLIIIERCTMWLAVQFVFHLKIYKCTPIFCDINWHKAYNYNWWIKQTDTLIMQLSYHFGIWWFICSYLDWQVQNKLRTHSIFNIWEYAT